jgi:hypothetical protein
MMGDKDYKQTINDALGALTNEITPPITNPKTARRFFCTKLLGA